MPANDTDVDGTIILGSVIVTAGPTNGTTSVNATTGVVTYTPDLNFFGVDSFNYTIADDDAATDRATVTVTVTDVNDPPVALDDTATTPEDTPVLIDVPANDTDVDGAIILSTVIVTSGPTNGTTSVNATTGVVTYTPDLNFFGVD